MNRQNKTSPNKLSSAAENNPVNKKEAIKDRLLDRHDMAEMFKVSLGTIYNWTSKGLFKIIPFPGRTYYDATDVEALLEEYKQRRVPGEKRGRKKKEK